MTRRMVTMISVVLVFLLASAQAQEDRRPKSPALTSEDLSATGTAPVLPEESITQSSLSGSAVRNARAALESALAKMREATSMRTRLQVSMPTGHREVTIDRVKPDRIHVISPEGEMIMIGRKFYLRSAEGWKVLSAASGTTQSDSGFDFPTFVRQLMGRSNVRVTGQIEGNAVVDGVETIAYKFQVSDSSDRGEIEICVGKADQFIRRMSVTGSGIGMRIWFSNIDEPISIEPPM